MSSSADSPRLPDAAPTTMSRDAIVVLAVLVFTAFLMLVNETTLSVALPTIMADFDVTAATAQWLLTGVMLTMAIMMPTTGWILDRFTTRQVYLFAVLAFLAGTVVAAVSPTFAVMLIGRVLQAIGTAVILPLQMTVVMTVVPVHRRGAVMGLVSVVMAVGPALGPTIAGLILSIADWHMIFWALVPLVAVAGLIGAWKLRNVGELRSTPLDVFSVILSAFAFGGLIYGLSSIGIIIDGGPTATLAIVLSVIGVLGLGLFVWRQLRLSRQGRALLDLRPLRVRNYTLAITSLLFLHAALLGVVNTLPLYLQGALLTTALVAGLVNLPGGILETIASPISGALFDRIGARVLVVPGAAVMAGSLFWLSAVDENTDVWTVVVIFAILSVGLAFCLTPLMTLSLSSLPKDLYSHGSAILNTLMQLAGAAGTAVLIAIYSYGSQTGGGTPEAQADGSGSAFFVAAWLSVAALVCALFLRKPSAQEKAVTVTEVGPE